MHASGIQLSDAYKFTINWIKDNYLINYGHDVIVNFFYVAVLLLSRLVIRPCFISTSWLALELWQFLFVKDWPEIQKSEKPLSAFCPISGDCCELEISSLARMSLKKVTEYCKMRYLFWVIKGKITRVGVGRGWVKLPPP